MQFPAYSIKAIDRLWLGYCIWCWPLMLVCCFCVVYILYIINCVSSEFTQPCLEVSLEHPHRLVDTRLKYKKKFQFTYFIPKFFHISSCKNVYIYTTSCKMNSNRAYLHGYCSPCKQFFNIIFSPLSNDFSSPTIATIQRARITPQPPNPAPPPNTEI